MQKLTEDYIVGLVDGEGSFTAYVRDPDSMKERVRRTRIEPRFYIKLIERDREVLDAVRQFFNCGNVYFQRDLRLNHQHCYRFEVANRSDLQNTIVPFFQSHPLRIPSRRHDFEIFCKIMRAIQGGEHLTREGWQRLFLLKQGMH